MANKPDIPTPPPQESTESSATEESSTADAEEIEQTQQERLTAKRAEKEKSVQRRADKKQRRQERDEQTKIDASPVATAFQKNIEKQTGEHLTDPEAIAARTIDLVNGGENIECTIGDSQTIITTTRKDGSTIYKVVDPQKLSSPLWIDRWPQEYVPQNGDRVLVNIVRTPDPEDPKLVSRDATFVDAPTWRQQRQTSERKAKGAAAKPRKQVVAPAATPSPAAPAAVGPEERPTMPPERQPPSPEQKKPRSLAELTREAKEQAEQTIATLQTFFDERGDKRIREVFNFQLQQLRELVKNRVVIIRGNDDVARALGAYSRALSDQRRTQRKRNVKDEEGGAPEDVQTARKNLDTLLEVNATLKSFVERVLELDNLTLGRRKTLGAFIREAKNDALMVVERVDASDPVERFGFQKTVEQADSADASLQNLYAHIMVDEAYQGLERVKTEVAAIMSGQQNLTGEKRTKYLDTTWGLLRRSGIKVGDNRAQAQAIIDEVVPFPSPQPRIPRGARRTDEIEIGAKRKGEGKPDGEARTRPATVPPAVGTPQAAPAAVPPAAPPARLEAAPKGETPKDFIEEHGIHLNVRVSGGLRLVRRALQGEQPDVRKSDVDYKKIDIGINAPQAALEWLTADKTQEQDRRTYLNSVMRLVLRHIYSKIDPPPSSYQVVEPKLLTAAREPLEALFARVTDWNGDRPLDASLEQFLQEYAEPVALEDAPAGAAQEQREDLLEWQEIFQTLINKHLELLKRKCSADPDFRMLTESDLLPFARAYALKGLNMERAREGLEKLDMKLESSQ